MLNREFEELVNEHSRRVLNVALRVLGNAELAQDVHQEVFLAIWRRWHKYDGQVNWGAYLYKVTVRKALEMARRPQLERLEPQRHEDPHTKEKPDGQLAAEELRQKLAHCLARLPKRQADIFVLSRIEGLRHPKIAEILGCSENTVRVHLHRAMKQLAAKLSDYLAE